MGFVASIFTAIVDVVVAIVEVVVQIVEMVVMLVMVLLGYDGGSTQIVEYFEVHNVPLFDDVDNKNPLLNSLLQSIIEEQDVTSNLIYHSAFRSLKGNVKDFLNYIEQGNYFENFPTVESYILVIDYDELHDALQTLTGVPCTVENAYLRALSKADWVKYWLQENRGYDVGINRLGEGTATVTTSPITPAADTVQVTPSVNHFDIAITSEIATSDSVTADQRWHVNLNTVSYNSATDDYTIPAYQNNGVTITLPYTAPTKPTQLHYVSTYYRNSNPSRFYLFIYQVGAGTYPELDTVEEPIDEDGSEIKALPAIPLRINNANYTTFGATKRGQIEGIMDIIHLEAEEVLDAILTDSGVAPGDLDHIYVNFGVRMWDTSQSGMGYLFNMFENLFPSQGITQGTYNNTPASDDKPQNNILITCDDYEYAFQWSYITYEFTDLATINANSGSKENGIYYSDMSRFDSNNILKYNYYVSSGKGTYNVGYKADNLDEVQDFLDGNGVPNPGTTSGEATNWLQVTERMSYNNHSPVLQESDGTTSSIIYLTPDAVYENNGSGVLRYVQQAAAETTIGQSITYYCVKPSGLDAYTVHAPIGALKVVDGDTGKFKIVKFNLGAKEDLMAPFIHNFIADLSNQEVSRLFLAGAHASIYIAHYEVIEHAGMSFLQALVMVVIIVVIVIVAWPMIKTGFAAMKVAFGKLVAASAAGTFLTTAWGMFISALPNMLIKMAAQYIIQLAITEIAGDNPELAAILNLISMVAVASWDPGVHWGTAPPGMVQPGTYGKAGGLGLDAAGKPTSIEFSVPEKSLYVTHDFHMPTPLEFGQIAMKSLTEFSTIKLQKVYAEMDLLEKDWERFQKLQDQTAKEMAGEETVLSEPLVSSDYIAGYLRADNKVGRIGAEKFFALSDAYYDIPEASYLISKSIDNQVNPGWQYA